MANFQLTKMAVDMFCPGNVVQLDDAGLPSVLVYIPAFKNSDVLTGGDDSIHPAFIVNGVQISGFYYSKYQNVVHKGKAYSLPAEEATEAGFEEALEYCEEKGYGWHLSTAAEWAAIALWCKKNGFLPHGNNDYGKDGRETDYKAISVEGFRQVVYTGTGPLTWSHDGTASGIWDLNGNDCEWQSGLRLVWGELQILANNNAADPDNPQNETSTCWRAINAATGALVDPESKTTDTAPKTSGSTVKLDWVNKVWTYSTDISTWHSNTFVEFVSVVCDDSIGDAAKVLLRALAMLPDEGATADDYEGECVRLTNIGGESFLERGGTYSTSLTEAGAKGVFYCTTGSRGNNGSSYFRAVYIPDMGR